MDFSQDRNLSATFADWLSVRQTIAGTETLEAKLKQTLQQATGGASKGIVETGAVAWKKAKDSNAIDLPALLKDYPEYQPLRHHQIWKPAIPARPSNSTHTPCNRIGRLQGFLLKGHNMLKGLAITPPVLGRISIGKVIEKNGKRRPKRTINSPSPGQRQAKDGWLPHPIDEALRKEQGGKIRHIRSACCSTIQN